MALISCSFHSKVLKMQSSMQVILPEKGPGIIGKKNDVPKGKFPVLWLYHGLSGNDTVWVRRTAIERYAETYGIAVVMPDASRSYYCNMAKGAKYWKFISEEVIQIARDYFPLSKRRTDNFVAGESMGGFGAFKVALNMPGFVSAAGSFSGTIDIIERLAIAEAQSKKNPGLIKEFRRIFGPAEHLPGSRNDLPSLLEKLAGSPDKKDIPKLYQCCGKDDLLLPCSRSFQAAAEKAGVDSTCREHSGYAHTWDYWELCIQDFLRWLAGQETG